MTDFLWPDHDYAWLAFFVLTILGAAAAVSTGRAFAKSWSPRWEILPAMIALAAGEQFLRFALFGEELLSVHYYLITFVILAAAAIFGYQSMRARQMSTQYSWAFERSGLSWRARA
jgi:hypothetical protein